MGDWSREQGQLSEAVRGYWEPTRIDPNLSTVWIRLAQVVRSLRSENPSIASCITDEQLTGIEQRIAELVELRKRFYDFSAGNLFRREASGRYKTLNDSSWGGYFSSPHVGRALWTLDINRDGHLDVLITHMYEHGRLLVNRGTDSNNQVAIQLVGTRSSRDATGAIVRFDCSGRKRTIWCLSGDGYFSSNERLLRAGLGTADHIENVSVTWQDGTMDYIGSLNANSEYVIVQGTGEAFLRDTMSTKNEDKQR